MSTAAHRASANATPPVVVNTVHRTSLSHDRPGPAAAAAPSLQRPPRREVHVRKAGARPLRGLTRASRAAVSRVPVRAAAARSTATTDSLPRC
eukprot:scaffold4141_cov335-Prasinococcus_capsulatus_cf.AAC.3